MDYRQALNEVLNGEAKPSYFFYGEETYFIEQLSDKLVKRFVDKAMKDFNYTVFHGSEITDQQLLQAVSEFPMMAEYRVVLCLEFDKIKLGNKDILGAYLANPLKSTIFIANASKIDKRKSIFKKMISSGFSFESKRLYDDTIPAWIMQKAQVDGYRISLPAAEELFAHIGSNIREIVAEMEKVYLFLKEGNNQIEIETIDKVCGFSREYSVFQLVNILLKRDIGKSILIGNYLITKGEPMTKILSGLYFQFNKLWQISHLVRNKHTDHEVATRLKIPVFFIRDEKKLATSVVNNQYKSIMKILADTDRKIKSTNISDKALFQRMIFEIGQCLQ